MSTPDPCHACKKRFDFDEPLVYSFAARNWHVHCFKCATCRRNLDTEERLLLLSDGRPVCRDCPYRCCRCLASVVDQSIQKDNVPVYEDSEPFNESTFVMFATRISRVWCSSCLLPTQKRLPPEIFRRIIQLSLPPPSPDRKPFDERSYRLLQLVTISQLFRHLAQAELFSEPRIHYWGQKKRFLRSLMEKRSLGESTRRIEIGPPGGGDRVHAERFEVELLVQLLPNLEDVELSSLDLVTLEKLSASRVRRLSIHYCTFPSWFFNNLMPFQFLVELCLVGLPVTEPAPNWMHDLAVPPIVRFRTLFPALRALTTETNHLLDEFVRSLVLAVRPQLRILSLLESQGSMRGNMASMSAEEANGFDPRNPRNLDTASTSETTPDPSTSDKDPNSTRLTNFGNLCTSLTFLHLPIVSICPCLPLFTLPLPILYITYNHLLGNPLLHNLRALREALERGVLHTGTTVYYPVALKGQSLASIADRSASVQQQQAGQPDRNATFESVLESAGVRVVFYPEREGGGEIGSIREEDGKGPFFSKEVWEKVRKIGEA